MISEVVAKILDTEKKSSRVKSSPKKAEIGGTFEIRINNNIEKTYLYNYIYKYKHWQNIIKEFSRVNEQWRV